MDQPAGSCDKIHEDVTNTVVLEEIFEGETNGTEILKKEPIAVKALKAAESKVEVADDTQRRLMRYQKRNLISRFSLSDNGWNAKNVKEEVRRPLVKIIHPPGGVDTVKTLFDPS